MSSFQQQDMSNDEAQYEPTSTNFHPRYTGPPPDEMTPQQLSLRHSILSTRPHTGLSGPFGPWLSVPAIASPSQELGRVVRYETTLSRRESELVILLTGAKYQSETEFDLHVGEARRAGVGWDVIRSIPRGIVTSSSSNNAVSMDSGTDSTQKSSSEEKFSFERVNESVKPLLIKEHDAMQFLEEEDGVTRITNENIKEREVAIVLFAAELLDSNTVSDETYATTRQVLGGDDSTLVEITTIVGYYAYVSYTLNVFRIPSSEVA
jgi:alkylhydroperoxidase family enzyme